MKRIFLTVLLAFTALFALAFAACADNGGKADNEGEVGNGGETVTEGEVDNGGETDNGGEADKGEPENMQNEVVFTIGETNLTATLEDNKATEALVEKLKVSPITVEMSDYGGWEKVGDLGFALPTSNSQITAQPCEFVLYQGDQLVIFYGSNSWSYTRLGKFQGVTQPELKEILGSGDVTVTISLTKK